MSVSTGQHALRTDELDYTLPGDRIALRPAEPRDSARMMVVWRSRPEVVHAHVRDLPQYLRPGDALTFNVTSVTPARLIGRRRGTAGRVEGLLLEELTAGAQPHWLVMLKAGGRLSQGEMIDLHDHSDQQSPHALELLERDNERWRVRLISPASTAEVLQQVGRTPLPPYILKARQEGHQAIADSADRAWYQTVYANAQHQASVAAPTAGLHFTPGLLQQIEAQNVRMLNVTLHVGAGTFKPVTAPTLDAHIMHAESYEVPAETLRAIHELRRRASGRLIAIGTTSVRTLESLPRELFTAPGESPEFCGPIHGKTDLLIAPPYHFKLVDGMLTNFHLPRSTLLALVAAMVGLDRLRALYREAIERQYRFYSYGDAMLVLP